MEIKNTKIIWTTFGTSLILAGLLLLVQITDVNIGMKSGLANIRSGVCDDTPGSFFGSWCSPTGYGYVNTGDEPNPPEDPGDTKDEYGPLCGEAARSYSTDEETWEGNLCDKGYAVPSNVSFPDYGKSVTWECRTDNDLPPITCSASKDDLNDYKYLILAVEGSVPDGAFSSTISENQAVDFANYMDQQKERMEKGLPHLVRDEVLEVWDRGDLSFESVSWLSRKGVVKNISRMAKNSLKNFVDKYPDNEKVVMVAAHSLGSIAVFNYKSDFEKIASDNTGMLYTYFDPPYNVKWSKNGNLIAILTPFEKLFWADLGEMAKARKNGIDKNSNPDTVEWTEGYPDTSLKELHTKYKTDHSVLDLGVYSKLITYVKSL